MIEQDDHQGVSYPVSNEADVGSARIRSDLDQLEVLEDRGSRPTPALAVAGLDSTELR